MIRGKLPATFCFLILIGFLFSFFPAKALTNHLIISQIQIASSTNANDEFVELYNPTDTDLSLAGLRLTRVSSTGGSPQNLVASLSGILSSHHYYLVAHPLYAAISTTPDRYYSASSSAVTANNTVFLYAADLTTVIDKVGFGTAQNFEASPAANPAPDQSLVRTSLEDTDNNFADFSLSASSAPRNSSFIDVSPTMEPSPTEIPVTMTVTPTPGPTSVPEVSPTSKPVPTPEPTLIPQKPSPAVPVINTPSPAPGPDTHKDRGHFFKKFLDSCHRIVQKFHWPRFSPHRNSGHDR